MPQSAQHGFRLKLPRAEAGQRTGFQCLNRHSMGSDCNLQAARGGAVSVSMPQSAQHGFRLHWSMGDQHYRQVSMPQSAQHGFRPSAIYQAHRDIVFQCLNRHSMGSDRRATLSTSEFLRFQCLNRHSMGSDQPLPSRILPAAVVSMPQSAQHGFRLPWWLVLIAGVFVSMPQSAQHGFRQRVSGEG